MLLVTDWSELALWLEFYKWPLYVLGFISG